MASEIISTAVLQSSALWADKNIYMATLKGCAGGGSDVGAGSRWSARPQQCSTTPEQSISDPTVVGNKAIS